MGYQIDKDGVIIRENQEQITNVPMENKKLFPWEIVGFAIALALLIYALLPESDSLDRLYKMNIPKGFKMEYNDGYSQRVYQDGNGGVIGVYYEGGGWGTVDDYLSKKELDISLYTPLQINWMDARNFKKETVDPVYNSYVILSNHGIFVIKFDYPIGRKSYYEGLMDEVVYSFKQK